MLERIIIIRGCIVMHTLRSRYLLLYRRVYVHIMLGRDIHVLEWISSMHRVSSGIIISGWCIVVHIISKTDLLRGSSAAILSIYHCVVQ